MDTIDPTSEPPAQANAASPAQPAASSPSAPAEQSDEASGASLLAQGGQSSEIAGSHSFPPVVDAQSAQLSRSAVDQAQQSAATVSDSSAPVPAAQPKEDSVVTGLPALVELAAHLPAPLEMDSAKQRGRPFQPGQSGNPLGRPKGSRNRVTQFVEALIEGQGEALGATAVQKALDGDSPMLREMLNRLVPRRHARSIEFDVPKIVTAYDARAASTALLAACTHGDISPTEATQFMGLLTSHVRLVETADLEPRLAALEKERKK
jgi:hypothetical protein